MSSIDTQVGGDHYRQGKIQPVEYIEANGLGFLEGCVVKRVTRHNRDGGKGRQDIEKAIHELQLLLELRYAEPSRGGNLREGERSPYITEPIVPTPCPAEPEWIDWHAGKVHQPLPGITTLVWVRLRNGENPRKAGRVGDWNWGECGGRTIVAYRTADDGHSETPAPKVTEWVSGVDRQPVLGRKIEIRSPKHPPYECISAVGGVAYSSEWRYVD